MGKLSETDRLLSQTRLGMAKPEDATTQSSRLDGWLKTLLDRKGSDLLLIPGAPASIRCNGEVQSIGDEPLDGPEIEAEVLPALSTHGLELYQQTHIGDSSYRIEGVGRFRINLHRERSLAAATIRALPAKLPSIKELHLPPAVEALAHLRKGLVLIGGAAGSGKSTTMAALVDAINRREARHIITCL